MNRNLLWLFCFVAFFQCKSNESIPENILNDDKMVSILTDIHLAEGYSRINGVYGDSAKEVLPAYYELILKKHNVERKVFTDSYYYYSTEPEKMNNIMNEVIINLSKLESGIKAGENKEKK